MIAPRPDFAHLRRLTDDTGLFEHARHATARRAHGYCTDDVARGLVVTCRQPDPDQSVLGLAEVYLTFLCHAQDKSGAFHNRLGFDRQWQDPAGLGDWWGRALWGLGTAAAHSPLPWLRTEALCAFALGAAQRSADPHAMAFAGLGAAQVLHRYPEDTAAASLLADAAATVSVLPADPAWPWPVKRLTYANAALAEVVILAGHVAKDQLLLGRGLVMLKWLHTVQSGPDGLSVIPAGGWNLGEERGDRDQQPIEVAALADAYATAFAVTGDPVWQTYLQQAVSWFCGNNDTATVMWDPSTHGGYDGLTPEGPNLNQGAESTLAFLSTMQHAQRMAPI
ncbi:hypothetical protein [Catelliglobosispora koreensis]|uniref:hypothetical protein n=1 Tax=Catelliglobosispora koreensis TaxID=129052 RepID=UPI00035EBBFC|nr:hypothetical protein [Catelliglobosispora koreensis]